MDFEKWLGRHVTVFRTNDERTYSARIDGWDPETGRLQLGPKPISILADEVLKIVPAEPGPFRRGPSAGIASRPHSVGYIMKEPLQFDNAVHFQSPVMIWKGDRLVHLHVALSAHNETEVELRSGERLSKRGHRFVVRSVHGN